MMNNTKAFFSAVAFATAAIAAPMAMAADISKPTQALVLIDGTVDFGATFGKGNKDNTFADKYTFTTTGVNYVDSLISSIAKNSAKGLDITGFALFTSTGSLIADGEQENTGKIDLWSLSVESLAAGSYYVQVSGNLVSKDSGSYGANLNLAPVPEPETYGMIIAGLGILGFLARRRKAA